MRRFEELEVVGDGAFGIVTKCRDKETGDLVAIKKMKKRYSSFEECLQLKEVKSLRKIKHQNIVRLLQVFRENEYLYLVFELMGKSLLNTINLRGGYPEDDIRKIMTQILTGLNYIHKQGFFHRDMKPDNLLWKDDDMSVLKIADFGLAREIRSRPPYTEYISTRWYRAPENILKFPNYNSPIDIWACGVIMAELFIARPLFQGTSETDQLYKIMAIIGPPTQKTWPEGVAYANKMGIRFSTTTACGLASVITNASQQALSLISTMLRYDPSKRPNAGQCLHHPFFTNPSSNISSNITNNIISNNNNNSNSNKSYEEHSTTNRSYNNQTYLNSKNSKDQRPSNSNSLSGSNSFRYNNYNYIPYQNNNVNPNTMSNGLLKDSSQHHPPYSMLNLVAGRNNGLPSNTGKKISGNLSFPALSNTNDFHKNNDSDFDDIFDDL